ncbi:MAG: hypothetical protein ACJ79W_09955 [Myxococcales bacterium]
MKTIREWAFPIALLIAWVAASTYTLVLLVHAHSEYQRILNPAAVTSPQT